MASEKQCRSALTRLTRTIDTIDPQTRSKHLPPRTVSCRVKDLGLCYTARLDEHGVHDLAAVPVAERHQVQADVRIALDSDVLVALIDRDEDFVNAWLHGRIQVSAPMRDMLRLRSVLGL